ncbi:MAG: hypothetical protein DRP09_16690, partial [Candidatus Thorarchaeota archaeon]
ARAREKLQPDESDIDQKTFFNRKRLYESFVTGKSILKVPSFRNEMARVLNIVQERVFRNFDRTGDGWYRIAIRMIPLDQLINFYGSTTGTKLGQGIGGYTLAKHAAQNHKNLGIDAPKHSKWNIEYLVRKRGDVVSQYILLTFKSGRQPPRVVVFDEASKAVSGASCSFFDSHLEAIQLLESSDEIPSDVKAKVKTYYLNQGEIQNEIDALLGLRDAGEITMEDFYSGLEKLIDASEEEPSKIDALRTKFVDVMSKLPESGRVYKGIRPALARITHGIAFRIAEYALRYVKFASMVLVTRDKAPPTKPDIYWTFTMGIAGVVTGGRRAVFDALIWSGILSPSAQYNHRWYDRDGNLLVPIVTALPPKQSYHSGTIASDMDIMILVIANRGTTQYVKEVIHVVNMHKHRSNAFDRSESYLDRDRIDSRSTSERFLIVDSASTTAFGGLSYVGFVFGHGRQMAPLESLVFYAKEYMLAGKRVNSIWTGRKLDETKPGTYELTVKAFYKRCIDILTGLDGAGSILAKVLETAEDDYDPDDWVRAAGANSEEAVRRIMNRLESLGIISSISPELRHRLEQIIAGDPGPLLADINFNHIYTFLQWYRDLFVLDRSITRMTPTGLSAAFGPLGIQDDTTVLIDSWLPRFMADVNISDDLKHTVLSTYAMDLMGELCLSDDWPYPPYQLGEWRFCGSPMDGWSFFGSHDSMTTLGTLGTFNVEQTVRTTTDMHIDRLHLFVDGAGVSDITLSVNLRYGSTLVRGSGVVKDGVAEISLDREVFVPADEIVTIEIPRQDIGDEVSVWLCSRTLLSSSQRTSTYDVRIGGSVLEGLSMFVGLHDSEAESMIGWQKVGTRLESGIDVDPEVLVGDAENYLDNYLASHPEDRLPRSWIAVTAFNTTDNSTSILFKEYENTKSLIYTEIPDASYQSTPVYVYGDAVPPDMVLNGLLISDYSSANYISTGDLVRIVTEKVPGIIVLLTSSIPAEVLEPDSSGVPLIQNWIRSGNQVVSAGVVPFQMTQVGIDYVPTSDYLFGQAISSPGTGRLVELSLESACTTPSVRTYQDPTGPAQCPAYLDLSTDNELAFSGVSPVTDGSLTFMFPLAIRDIDPEPTREYQWFDIVVNDDTVLSRVGLNQFRNGITGEGRSFTTYDEDSVARLFVQHVGDIENNDTTMDAHYLLYLTMRGVHAGSYDIRLRGSGHGPSTQVFVHDYESIIDWEAKDRADLTRAVQSQYQGAPDIGAGVFVATGLDMVRTSESVARETFTMGSAIGLAPTRTLCGIDMTAVRPYRTYATDVTGKYGEATIQVGAGMVTMIDMVPTGADWVWDTLAELNYVLTGIIGDWRATSMGTGVEVGFGPQTNGPDFEGLLADMNIQQVTERVAQPVVADSDYKYEGHYANSFSVQVPLKISNCILDWSTGSSLYVDGSVAGASGVFSVTLNGTGMDGSEAKYLAVDIGSNDCHVSLNTTTGF